MRSSRYEARGKFGEHERCVRVARGVADRIGGFMYPSVSKYINHFPTLFLDSHLALRHLVNTKPSVSQTTKMAHSDAAVQKAS